MILPLLNRQRSMPDDYRQSPDQGRKRRSLLLAAALLTISIGVVAMYFVAYLAMGPKQSDAHGATRYYRHEWLAGAFGPAAALESKLTGEFVNTGWWEHED